MLSLIRWGELLAGSTVIIRSDNIYTVSALNKSTSWSTEIMLLVRQIFWLCVMPAAHYTTRSRSGGISPAPDSLRLARDWHKTIGRPFTADSNIE